MPAPLRYCAEAACGAGTRSETSLPVTGGGSVTSQVGSAEKTLTKLAPGDTCNPSGNCRTEGE